MQSDEQLTHKDKKPSRLRRNLELYYVERVGSRYYFRVTALFWILLILAVVYMFAVPYFANRRSQEKLDINTPQRPESSLQNAIVPVLNPEGWLFPS